MAVISELQVDPEQDCAAGSWRVGGGRTVKRGSLWSACREGHGLQASAGVHALVA